MADLRYRTFRMKAYAQMCPRDLRSSDRDRFLRLLDEMDEDGMIDFFQQVPLEPKQARAFGMLREAREIGDRLNAMDRTLPVLPHSDIAACYERLRALGDEIGEALPAEIQT